MNKYHEIGEIKFHGDFLEAIIEGDLADRAQQLVQEWAGLYQKELLEMWNRQEFEQLPGLE